MEKYLNKNTCKYVLFIKTFVYNNDMYKKNAYKNVMKTRNTQKNNNKTHYITR